MKKSLKVVLFVLCLLIVSAAVLHVWYDRFYEPTGKGYQTFISPDGNHTIEIYLMNGLIPLPTMPGQGGDGPGLLVLRDNQGRTLHKIKIDGANSIDDNSIMWEDDHVFLISIGELRFDGSK